MQVFGEAAYAVDVEGARIEPFANLSYVHLSTDEFSEAGGAAALISAKRGADVAFTTLGLRAKMRFDLGAFPASLQAHTGWRHAFNDVTPSSAQMLAGGSAFIVAGVPVAADAFALGLGASMNLTDKAMLGISYAGQFGSGFSDSDARANFSFRF